MRGAIILGMAASFLSGCSRAAPRVLHTITIGQAPTGDEFHLALTLTIAAPPGRGAGFLFTDKVIEEIDAADTLLLMIGAGAAWDPNGGVVGCHAYNGLEKERDYVRVDWEMLGFDKAEHRRIVDTGKRHGVKASDTIYTFGTYWLGAGDRTKGRIRQVIGREEVCYLYTFELIERGKFVVVVRKRRQRVRIVSPREAPGGNASGGRPATRSQTQSSDAHE